MKHKRLYLILLYMAIIYCVVIAEIHYAREHPLQDVRATPPKHEEH